MKPFNFENASSVNEALQAKSSNKKYIAGGTNLVDLMKKNISQPDTLINITSALSKDIEYKDNVLNIGAMASNSKIATNQQVINNFPLIAKAILAGASPQIRNMASAAGNLLQRTRCPYFYDLTTACNKRKSNSGCSAYNGENRMSAIIGYNQNCVAVHPSDFCIALAALDATVTYTTDNGSERKISFKDFHKLPDTTPWLDNNLPENAIITKIEVEKNPFNNNFSYIKIRDRTSYAFALISVAATIEIVENKIKQARLASGGVAHKPWRWYEAEKFLVGKKPTQETFIEAAEIAVRNLKPLSGNAYKITMLEGAIITALKECVNI